jgi:serine/threonine protein kinase
VPGYEVLRPIGSGGMGVVYTARQLSLGRLVAIKFLSVEDDPEAEGRIARFRREAELMARVSHPNVLAVHDFGVVSGRPYIVMEQAAGGDLRRMMADAGGPLPPPQVRAVLAPVVAALDCLHRHEVLHRDLKPENILIDEVGVPKVADFGIAMLQEGPEASSATGRMRLGTVGYAAPEQQYLGRVDERSDQYALAAIAYELLTGQRPLGLFKPPSAHVPGLGHQVDAAVLRALREEPKERFATIKDFGRALDRGLAEAGVGRMRRFVRLAGVGLLGVLLIIAAVRFRPQPAPAPSPVPPDPPVPVLAEAQTQNLFHQFTEHRAHILWIEAGRPTGEPGRALQDSFWFQAEREVRSEVGIRAYEIWVHAGRPTGTEGERMRPINEAKAVRELLEKERDRRQRLEATELKNP